MSASEPEQPSYRRILLKLSGEALMGDQTYGVDPAVADRIATDIAEIQSLGVEASIVIGGGNIFRGLAASARGMDRSTADYMGMLATVINALALQDALEKHDVPTRVLTAIEMRSVAEPFIRRRAIRHLEKGRVVVFAAGTGNPYFTTDTAAALRAMEIKADVILKGTKVDGIYTADPVKDPNATRYERVTYMQVLQERLQVMDATAVSLCMDNKLPIVVFNLKTPGNIRRVVMGEVGRRYRGDGVGTSSSAKFQGRGRQASGVEGAAPGRSCLSFELELVTCNFRGSAMDVSDLKGLFAEVKKRMDGQLEFVRKELAGVRTGRASTGLLEARAGRGVWLAHAAQSGGEPVDPGAVADRRAAVRPVAHGDDRASHSRLRSGAEPGERRQGHPHPDSVAHRRAPQGPVAPRPQDGRGRPQSRPRGPPRGQRQAEEDAQGAPDLRGRREARARRSAEDHRRHIKTIDDLQQKKDQELLGK